MNLQPILQERRYMSRGFLKNCYLVPRIKKELLKKSSWTFVDMEPDLNSCSTRVQTPLDCRSAGVSLLQWLPLACSASLHLLRRQQKAAGFCLHVERLPPAWPVSIITSLESIWYCSLLFVYVRMSHRRDPPRGRTILHLFAVSLCISYIFPSCILGNWEALETRFWEVDASKMIQKDSLLPSGVTRLYLAVSWIVWVLLHLHVPRLKAAIPVGSEDWNVDERLWKTATTCHKVCLCMLHPWGKNAMLAVVQGFALWCWTLLQRKRTKRQVQIAMDGTETHNFTQPHLAYEVSIEVLVPFPLPAQKRSRCLWGFGQNKAGSALDQVHMWLFSNLYPFVISISIHYERRLGPVG